MKKGAIDRCYRCSRHSPNPDKLRVTSYSDYSVTISCGNCGNIWMVDGGERDCSSLPGYAEAKARYDALPHYGPQNSRYQS